MSSLHNFGLYTNNVLGAIVGKSEGFYDDKKESVSYSSVGAYAGIGVLLFFIFIIANLYGAARLSWCYNTFYGTTGFARFFWSLLCFFFSGFYYPFYAIFLDPVCGRVAQVGGRKH
jgi:hypothetical protein